MGTCGLIHVNGLGKDIRILVGLLITELFGYLLDLATLGFTYNIQESAGFEEEDLINDIHFRNYIGGVLQNLIEDSLDNGAVIGHNESDTDTHTQSSN